MLAVAFLASIGAGVLAAEGELPAWAATPLGWGTVVVFLGLLIVGKLRTEREVLAAQATAAEWKATAQLETEARQAAERAAAHIIDSANRDVMFINTIREAYADRAKGRGD